MSLFMVFIVARFETEISPSPCLVLYAAKSPNLREDGSLKARVA
jgi:hypothetical protein